MDVTDQILEAILKKRRSEKSEKVISDGVSKVEVKSDAQKLEEVMLQIQDIVKYRAAKRVVVRDEEGYPVSVEVEGYDSIKINQDEDGLIESIGGSTK